MLRGMRSSRIATGIRLVFIGRLATPPAVPRLRGDQLLRRRDLRDHRLELANRTACRRRTRHRRTATITLRAMSSALTKPMLLDVAQVDALDDQLAEFAAQDVRALLADGDDLDRLACRSAACADMVARQRADLRVEAAAQTAFGRADHAEDACRRARCRSSGRAHPRRSTLAAMLASTAAMRFE